MFFAYCNFAVVSVFSNGIKACFYNKSVEVLLLL